MAFAAAFGRSAALEPWMSNRGPDVPVEISRFGCPASNSGPEAPPFGPPISASVPPKSASGLVIFNPPTSDPFGPNVWPFAVRYGSSLSAPPAQEKQFGLFFFVEDRPNSADGLCRDAFGPRRSPLA